MLHIEPSLKTIIFSSENLTEEGKEEFFSEVSKLPPIEQSELSSLLLEQPDLLPKLYNNLLQKKSSTQFADKWNEIIKEEIAVLEE